MRTLIDELNETRWKLFLCEASLSVVFVSFLVLSCVQPIYGAQTPQTEAKANHLDRWNLPSRSLAVGGAYSADADGLQGGLTNPASLSRLQTHQFSVEHQNWRQSWKLFDAGIAVPMYGGHSLSLHGTWLDYGELEPESDTELFRPQGNEFKGGLSYSYRATRNSAIGFSGGFMTSEIGFRDREYEPYVDLGYIRRMPNDLWFGLTVKNVVGDLVIEDGEDKLPLQARGGFAWYLWQNRLTLTADAVYHDPEESADEETSFGGAGGLRALFFEHYRFSVGYHNYYEDRDGLTGGLQIEYPNFKWKFSFMDTGTDNLVRLGGNMRF